MATTTATPTNVSAPRTAPRVRTLDDLAELSTDTLEALYRAAPASTSVASLVGKPKGRMLAVRHTDGTPAFGLLRGVAGLGVFPWDGKTFGALRADEGTGINRVKLLPLRLDWFPFRTRIEPSVVDGKDCVYLDYEQPGNPFFIARIRDEIREVAPGLWLGPAMWKKSGGGAVHVLWFAVDFNSPSN